MMKKTFVMTLILISLTGCVEYQWVKPGTDQQQEEMAELRESVALDVVPERAPVGTRLRNGLILLVTGAAIGLLLTRLL